MSITNNQLIMRQSMPLNVKVLYTENRIRQWYKHYDGKVYVSFSGGKDSTVLLHIVRSIYPEVVAVFVDTGLEYPEIKEFVKTIDNVTWLKSKMPFNKVIEKYGYPVISKEVANIIYQIRNTKSEYLLNKRLNGLSIDKKGKSYACKTTGKIPIKWEYLVDAPFKISSSCCNVMKKAPIKSYENKSKKTPFIGTMACESAMRTLIYYRNGCNAFDKKRPSSQPISFWKEEDIWDYIKTNNLEYSKIYDMGYKRTGCMFCMFGVHLEKSDLFNKNRFQLMKDTHPKQYNYCINKLGCGKVMDYIGVDYT